MNRSALQLDRPAALFHSPALRRMADSGALRIGYAPASPWIYRTNIGLRGHDATAAAQLAQALGVDPWFVESAAGELPELLAAGAIDVAVGGLVDCGWPGVACVRARHVVEDLATPPHRRQMFFPNVWWVNHADRVWRLRVHAFLLAQRARARLQSGASA